MAVKFGLILEIVIILRRNPKLLYFLSQILPKFTNISRDIYPRHYCTISTRLLFNYRGSISLQVNFRSCEKVYQLHGLDKYSQSLKIINSTSIFSTRGSKPIQRNLKLQF